MDRFYIQTSTDGKIHTVRDRANSDGPYSGLAPVEFDNLQNAEAHANMLNNHPNYSHSAWERLWDRAHRVDHALDPVGFNLFWCCGMGDEFMIVDRRGFEHYTIELHHDRDLSGITGDETLDNALSNIPESLPDPIPQLSTVEVNRANDCAGIVFNSDDSEDGEYALVYSLCARIFGLYFIPDGIVNDWNWAKSPTDIVDNLDWLMG